MVTQLKTDALATPYTGPNDAGDPYEYFEAYENEQILKVMLEATFSVYGRSAPLLYMAHGGFNIFTQFRYMFVSVNSERERRQRRTERDSTPCTTVRTSTSRMFF